MFSAYILSRREIIFDPRNIRVGLLTDDDLGPVMGLRSFHRSQVVRLVREQLIPAELGCCSVNPYPHVRSTVEGAVSSNAVDTLGHDAELPSFLPILQGRKTREVVASSRDER